MFILCSTHSTRPRSFLSADDLVLYLFDPFRVFLHFVNSDWPRKGHICIENLTTKRKTTPKAVALLYVVFGCEWVRIIHIRPVPGRFQVVFILFYTHSILSGLILRVATNQLLTQLYKKHLFLNFIREFFDCLDYFERLLCCKPLEIWKYICGTCALNPSQNNLIN